MELASKISDDRGATAVITHSVREGKHAEYEIWLKEITPICKASLGYLDWHIIRPIAGLNDRYTIIIRFDTAEHLQQWMNSSARARLIEKARPLFLAGDNVAISSGLDFWFAPVGGSVKVPVKWKQCLITWSAIYPLVLIVPFFVTPVLRLVGAPENHLLTTLAVSGTIVFLMVYLVMPRYTNLLRAWLFA